jgi:hypothetical protein
MVMALHVQEEEDPGASTFEDSTATRRRITPWNNPLRLTAVERAMRLIMSATGTSQHLTWMQSSPCTYSSGLFLCSHESLLWFGLQRSEHSLACQTSDRNCACSRGTRPPLCSCAFHPIVPEHGNKSSSQFLSQKMDGSFVVWFWFTDGSEQGSSISASQIPFQLLGALGSSVPRSLRVTLHVLQLISFLWGKKITPGVTFMTVFCCCTQSLAHEFCAIRFAPTYTCAHAPAHEVRCPKNRSRQPAAIQMENYL